MFLGFGDKYIDGYVPTNSQLDANSTTSTVALSQPCQPTKDKVLVLDLNYEEKVSIDIKRLKDKNLELVYRRNNLYYEEKVKDDGKIIYRFYNVETCELEFETSLGGI